MSTERLRQSEDANPSSQKKLEKIIFKIHPPAQTSLSHIKKNKSTNTSQINSQKKYKTIVEQNTDRVQRKSLARRSKGDKQYLESLEILSKTASYIKLKRPEEMLKKVEKETKEIMKAGRSLSGQERVRVTSSRHVRTVGLESKKKTSQSQLSFKKGGSGKNELIEVFQKKAKLIQKLYEMDKFYGESKRLPSEGKFIRQFLFSLHEAVYG